MDLVLFMTFPNCVDISKGPFDYPSRHLVANEKTHCSTVQAFCADLPAWDRGSPSLYALHATPIAPLLLIHSMQDDWVQASQATQLYDRLKPSGGGGSVLDVKGRCVFGQHEDVLSGKSAAMLATCILQFAAAT